MPDSTCSVDDCERLHHARGLCSAHYKRWRRCGDPLKAHKAKQWCDVEGCQKYPRARGLCSTHYQVWQRHGDPRVADRRRAERENRTHKRCAICQEPKLLSEFVSSPSTSGGLDTRCKQCHREREAKRRAGNPSTVKAKPRQTPSLRAELAAKRTRRHNAAKVGAPGEGATLSELIAVHGLLCHWQGPPCTWIATEVDHVIPLSKGGSNYPTNQKPICKACNRSKNNRL